MRLIHTITGVCVLYLPWQQERNKWSASNTKDLKTPQRKQRNSKTPVLNSTGPSTTSSAATGRACVGQQSEEGVTTVLQAQESDFRNQKNSQKPTLDKEKGGCGRQEQVGLLHCRCSPVLFGCLFSVLFFFFATSENVNRFFSPNPLHPSFICVLNRFCQSLL